MSLTQTFATVTETVHHSNQAGIEYCASNCIVRALLLHTVLSYHTTILSPTACAICASIYMFVISPAHVTSNLYQAIPSQCECHRKCNSGVSVKMQPLMHEIECHHSDQWNFSGVQFSRVQKLDLLEGLTTYKEYSLKHKRCPLSESSVLRH